MTVAMALPLRLVALHGFASFFVPEGKVKGKVKGMQMVFLGFGRFFYKKCLT